MRYILFLLIVFLASSCNNLNKTRDSIDVSVEARVIRSFDTLLYSDTLVYHGFDVNLSIINRSQKPISFWVMTCSWDENILINNDYIRLLLWACDHNFPTIKQIEKNDSLIYVAPVIRLKSSQYTTTETRFGFILIDTIACKTLEDYLTIIGDKSKQNRIIWSNPLHLGNPHFFK
jgi:hypothetical protein